MGQGAGDLHRIGGGTVENLRLKPSEAKLNPPGISVLRAPTPQDAAQQVRGAFPEATDLLEQAKIIGSTTEQQVRDVGFEVIPNPTRRLPNHQRIVHPEGVVGFNENNLKRLSEVFTNTSGH